MPAVELLKQAAAGASLGFTAQVIEDHIRGKVMEAESKSGAARAGELIGIVHSDIG